MIGFEILSSQELVEKYQQAAVLHGEGTSSGDHTKTNKSFAVIRGVYRELRRRGEGDQKLLLPLLESEYEAVRVWAAAHSLEFRPDQGEPVLEAVASGPPSPQRMVAQMTLQEWRKGSLIFP